MSASELGSNVIELRPVSEIAIEEPKLKFSFDIIQTDEESGMMLIDGCLPVPVVMELLKLLEPYA